MLVLLDVLDHLLGPWPGRVRMRPGPAWAYRTCRLRLRSSGGGPAGRVAGRGDAAADRTGGLARLRPRRPDVADAERGGGSASGRRRRRDGDRRGRGRRSGVHGLVDGSVARRAGADAGSASGRRIYGPGHVTVVRLGPDAVEPTGFRGAGGSVVGRSGAGFRGAVARRAAVAVRVARRAGGVWTDGCGAGLWPAGGPPFGGHAAARLRNFDLRRDYRLGYSLGALGVEKMDFELGVETQRRERRLHNGSDLRVLGRASVRW